MKLTKLFEDFFSSEKSAGLILMACTIVSLVVANSVWGSQYLAFWHTDVAGNGLSHWVNDGLMAIFFLLVGLELEREVYIGELSTLHNALLPVIAAIGGMVVPAGIHFLFNNGMPSQPGAGIPMATDIAFALAVLSLLGNRVPTSLKVFLTALAVIDDLGAILVIAIFYTGSLEWTFLLVAMAIFGVMLVMNRLRIYRIWPYLICAAGMWYFMLHSGIHATIAGVLSAFAIPFGNGDEKSTSYILQHRLHKPVAFIILPLFALANTAIVVPGDWLENLLGANSLGIFAGLLAGKPIGIFLFAYLFTVAGITTKPQEMTWKHIAGVGLLGGIGFTMSMFISMLAFDDADLIDQSKIAILLTSALAGIVGYAFLKITPAAATGKD